MECETVGGQPKHCSKKRQKERKPQKLVYLANFLLKTAFLSFLTRWFAIHLGILEGEGRGGAGRNGFSRPQNPLGKARPSFTSLVFIILMRSLSRMQLRGSFQRPATQEGATPRAKPAERPPGGFATFLYFAVPSRQSHFSPSLSSIFPLSRVYPS